MTVPTPSLKYHFWSREDRPSLAGVVYEADVPGLYSMHTASASMHRGELTVYLEGPMLKRDGTRGRHNRTFAVDPEAQQPLWLQELMQDARTRLTTGADQ